jgi:hypothetical protein
VPDFESALPAQPQPHHHRPAFRSTSGWQLAVHPQAPRRANADTITLPAGFYTPETLATNVGVQLSTIYSWNSSGYGPPYVKLGNIGPLHLRGRGAVAGAAAGALAGVRPKGASAAGPCRWLSRVTGNKPREGRRIAGVNFHQHRAYLIDSLYV